MTIKRRLYDNILQRDITKAYKRYSSMKNMTYEEIEQYRLKKLQEIIWYAYKYVPFYKELRDSHNINTTIKSLNDFENFPIVDKKMIKDAIQKQTLFSTELKKKPKIIWEHTTWSTWNPLEFPFTKKELDNKNWYQRMYEERYCWRTFDDKKVRVWRWKYKKTLIDKLREFLTNTYLICIYDPKHTKETFLNNKRLEILTKELIKIKPKYIETFPSALWEIAKFIKNNNIKIDFNVDWIISWAEQLLEADKNILESVFSTNVFDRFGWTDSTLMAFQCKHIAKEHKYHVDELWIYLESINPENNSNIYDNPWEAVITDLNRKYAPFIRYKVWDQITLSSNDVSQCKHCWIFSRTIDFIWGRFNDTIQLSNWDKISPHLWQNILKKYEFIDTYQIIKKKECDNIIIKIVCNWDKNWLEKLKDELKNSFTWVNFEFEFVKYIDRNIWWKISQILIEK